METYSQQGKLKKTVVIEFESYKLTIEAGMEIAIFVAVSEPAVDLLPAPTAEVEQE